MANNFPTLKTMQWKMWLLGVFKIPMIAYCRPKLVQFDETFAVIKIRNRRRMRNHLNSIYFGALMVGGDLSAGLHAYAYSVQRSERISLAFKSCEAQFLMRAESDVYFVNSKGREVAAMMEEAKNTGERQNLRLPIDVFDAENNKVAIITMELSIKVKN
jgi:hypothetical protein